MTGQHKKAHKSSTVLANRYAAITLSLGAVLGIGAAGAAPAMAESQPSAASEVSHPGKPDFEGALGALVQNVHMKAARRLYCHGHETGVGMTTEPGEVRGRFAISSRLAGMNLKQYAEMTAKGESGSAAGKEAEKFLKNLQSGKLTSDANETLKQEVFDLSKILKQITDLVDQIKDQVMEKVDPAPHKPFKHGCGHSGTENPGHTGSDGGWQPVKDVTDHRIQQIAAWAVSQANREQHLTDDAAYHAVSLQSAETQVVSGTNYRLRIRLDRPSAQVVEAVVYEMPWENVHKLTSFKKVS
ncbi:cystatin domain-containing protein [Streptomyces sp. NPDC007205]|uniref:cystatin domain-containing protein n=1 Tax=Streptomyces sp. NPDC007205 TaxID=3154316 RepID=UPI0033DE1FE6